MERLGEAESPLRARPTELLIFVDETGDESLLDDRHPVFGYCGCAVVGADYAKQVAGPWRAMKARLFGGEDVPMHAAGGKLSEEQMAALGGFFKERRFYRLGGLVKRSTKLEEPIVPYLLAAGLLQRRIEDVARREDAIDRVSVILEESERTKPLVESHLGAGSVQFGRNGMTVRLPLRWFRMMKTSREPGLEVADFVAQAAGCQVRSHEKSPDRRRWRLDFQAVFQSVAARWVSFIEADEAAAR